MVTQYAIGIKTGMARYENRLKKMIESCTICVGGKSYWVEEIPEGHDKYCEGSMCYCSCRIFNRKNKKKKSKTQTS